MRFAFNYPCRVGVVTLDGDMTTTVFDVGDVVDVVNAGCLLLEPQTHMDFEMEDGTLLLGVPCGAIRMMESEDAGV